MHQQQGKGSIGWDPAKLLTLFRGNRLVYFEVSLAATPFTFKWIRNGTTGLQGIGKYN